MIAAPLSSKRSSQSMEAYLERINRPEPADLVALRERTAVLPFVASMQGAPSVARLLRFLIAVTGATRVLEVGVFTGCSTLAMAAALPSGGRITAIDISETWMAVGREYWHCSGVADRIDVRVGDAIDVLDALAADGLTGAFDLAFIDANKDAYDAYFERCLTLLRHGGVMLFDNVLFGGRVHPDCSEARIRAEEPRRPKSLQDVYVSYAEGLRRFNDRIARDERVDAIVLPMADGVTLARRR